MEGSGHYSSLRVILLRRTAYTATSTSSWSQGCFLTRCCLVPRKHVVPRTLMNNSPPFLTLLFTKEEEKGLVFRHEIQILARIREMEKRQSGTSFAAVLSAKLKTQVYTHTLGGHYRKEKNSLARGGTFEYVALDYCYSRKNVKEMRIREFSSWSIEPGNFLLYRYFFFFKISRLSFVRCFEFKFRVVRRFSCEK